LVFLHEGLGSVAMWRDFPLKVAQATGCSAVVYSRYGYGQSDVLRSPHGVDYMHCEALDACSPRRGASAARRTALAPRRGLHALRGARCAARAALAPRGP